jgi:hypothetical protein
MTVYYLKLSENVIKPTVNSIVTPILVVSAKVLTYYLPTPTAVQKSLGSAAVLENFIMYLLSQQPSPMILLSHFKHTS